MTRMKALWSEIETTYCIVRQLLDAVNLCLRNSQVGNLLREGDSRCCGNKRGAGSGESSKGPHR
jgi:hypothetical protein